MDVDYLRPEEILIECEVRDFNGPPDAQVTFLKQQLRLEVDEGIDPPNRPNLRAKKRPREEVKKCSAELHQIYKTFQESLDQPKQNVIRRLHAQTMHILGRLGRMQYSVCVRADVIKLEGEANQLIGLLDKSLLSFADQTDPVNEEDIRNINLTALDENYDAEENKSEKTGTDQLRNFGGNLIASSPITITENPQPLINRLGEPSHSRDVLNTGNVQNPIIIGSSNSNTRPPSTEVKNQTTGAPGTNPNSGIPIPYLLQNVPLPRPSNVPSSDPYNGLLGDLLQQPTNITPSNPFNGAGLPLPPPNIPLSTEPFNLLNDVQPRSFSNFNGQPIPRPGYFYRPTFAGKNAHQNVCFDGSPSGLPVERFLFRVEVMSRSIGMQEESLKDELHFFLKGSAMEFYWSMVEKHKERLTWNYLKNEFLERYRDRRNDFDIMRAIGARTQKPTETFMEFYSKILDMSLSLKTPLPEYQLLMILDRNMSTDLQHHLAGETFHTVASLVNRCVSTEDSWSRARESVKLRPPKRVEEIDFQTNLSAKNEEELLCQQIEALQLRRNNNSNFRPTHQPQNSAISAMPNNSKLCWNCHHSGHLFKNCTAGRILHTFCFGCGTPNTFKPNCQNCNLKTENAKGATMSGNLRPSSNETTPREEPIEVATNTDPEFYRLQGKPH